MHIAESPDNQQIFDLSSSPVVPPTDQSEYDQPTLVASQSDTNQMESPDLVIPKFAALEDQLNSINDSVGDSLNELENTVQETIARLKAVESKNDTHAESLKSCTKFPNILPLEKCKPHKQQSTPNCVN